MNVPAETLHFAVGATATLVFPANKKRREVILQNADIVTMEFGHDANLTYGEGHPIPPGQVWSDDVDQESIYVITASASADLRGTEIEESD
jgi:hypothetical protein